MSQEQKTISKYFNKRPVLYIGGLGTVFGLQAGVLLSQLLYWSSKGARKDGFIYKTEKEITAELGLTRTQQETAIRKLTELGVINYKLAQVPARKHFKVNMQRLHEVIPSLKETHNLTYPNPSRYIVENPQSITEITQETTAKNTRPIVDRQSYLDARKRLIVSKTASPRVRKGMHYGRN